MKTSAYRKRQTASAKRAEKTRGRRIKNADAINAERERRIRERTRHRCEDHDRPMMSASGMRYEMADRNSATCYGGIGLAHAIARQSGLADAIDRHVELLHNHFPYHESDHVLNIAFNAMTDGTCLEDLKKKRGDEAYLNALGAKRIPEL